MEPFYINQSIIFKTSPHLLQPLKRMLHRCLAARLQKCSVVCATSSDFPSTRGWADHDWIFIFGANCSFYELTLDEDKLKCAFLRSGLSRLSWHPSFYLSIIRLMFSCLSSCLAASRSTVQGLCRNVEEQCCGNSASHEDWPPLSTCAHMPQQMCSVDMGKRIKTSRMLRDVYPNADTHTHTHTHFWQHIIDEA